MRFSIFVLSLALLAPGCAALGPRNGPMAYENPVLVPSADPDVLWDQLVAVVDDYFQIDREERVRIVDGVPTVGRIDTFPEVGATLFEPWRKDAANFYERLEGTLQTIRRRAIVQVIPADVGYLVEVTVYKELEDVRRARFATADLATFADASTARATDQAYINNDPMNFPPVGPPGEGGRQPVETGWIPEGRDAALEQKIICNLLAALSDLEPYYRSRGQAMPSIGVKGQGGPAMGGAPQTAPTPGEWALPPPQE
jgi:hypothetical protein